MDSKPVTGTAEFTSYQGQKNIDAQIEEWLALNPGVSIVDIKYQAVIYKTDGKERLARLALLLYSGQKSSEKTPQAAKQAEEKPQSPSKKPSMSSMVISMRKDLGLSKDQKPK